MQKPAPSSLWMLLTLQVQDPLVKYVDTEEIFERFLTFFSFWANWLYFLWLRELIFVVFQFPSPLGSVRNAANGEFWILVYWYNLVLILTPKVFIFNWEYLIWHQIYTFCKMFIERLIVRRESKIFNALLSHSFHGDKISPVYILAKSSFSSPPHPTWPTSPSPLFVP